MKEGKRIGLALSGGGYRAAAFHLGTLKKLNELQILDKVDVLSTISGGSITGAAWCLHEKDYSSFHDYMIKKITTANVIRQVLLSWSFFQLVLFVLIFFRGCHMVIIYVLGPLVLYCNCPNDFSFAQIPILYFPQQQGSRKSL